MPFARRTFSPDLLDHLWRSGTSPTLETSKSTWTADNKSTIRPQKPLAAWKQPANSQTHQHPAAAGRRSAAPLICPHNELFQEKRKVSIRQHFFFFLFLAGPIYIYIYILLYYNFSPEVSVRASLLTIAAVTAHISDLNTCAQETLYFCKICVFRVTQKEKRRTSHKCS